MGLFHLAKLFGITIRESANDGSDFSNPDADYRVLFLGEDGALHTKDSAGSVATVDGGAAAHIADTTDAHDASAVSFDPSGLAIIAGTEVQTALEELDAAVDGLGPGGTLPGWIDEFIGTTDTTHFYWDGNDLASFTEVDITGSTTWAEGGNLASVLASGMTNEDANCILVAKTINTGDAWTVPVLGFMGHATAGVAVRVGIIFTDGTTSTSAAVAAHVQYAEDAIILVGRHGTLTNLATAPWVLDDELVGEVPFIVYCKLTYVSANTFRAEFSPNGVQYHAFGEADISVTLTPTHVGLFVQVTEADGGIATFGPLRKV